MTRVLHQHPDVSSRPYYLDARACPNCGDRLFAALWADHVNERCVRNVWCCDSCGYEFATSVTLPPD